MLPLIGSLSGTVCPLQVKLDEFPPRLFINLSKGIMKSLLFPFFNRLTLLARIALLAIMKTFLTWFPNIAAKVANS